MRHPMSKYMPAKIPDWFSTSCLRNASLYTNYKEIDHAIYRPKIKKS